MGLLLTGVWASNSEKSFCVLQASFIYTDEDMNMIDYEKYTFVNKKKSLEK